MTATGELSAGAAEENGDLLGVEGAGVDARRSTTEAGMALLPLGGVLNSPSVTGTEAKAEGVVVEAGMGEEMGVPGKFFRKEFVTAAPLPKGKGIRKLRLEGPDPTPGSAPDPVGKGRGAFSTAGRVGALARDSNRHTVKFWEKTTAFNGG